jgi:hypothetical protein
MADKARGFFALKARYGLSEIFGSVLVGVHRGSS